MKTNKLELGRRIRLTALSFLLLLNVILEGDNKLGLSGYSSLAHGAKKNFSSLLTLVTSLS
ncbi:MAG: hypothetical protein ACUZ8E_06710 [Candidatus Anammoxibacter sp.]